MDALMALGVDYEMSGKDLIDLGPVVFRDLPRSRRQSAGWLPTSFSFDDKAKRFPSPAMAWRSRTGFATLRRSLAQFMFQKPTAAKRLYLTSS